MSFYNIKLHQRRKPRWLRIAFALILSISTLFWSLDLFQPPIAHAATCSVVTISRISSPIFYIDTGVTPTPRGMYVGYKITNTSGANYSDLWVKLGNFTGGSVQLAPTEDGIMHIGPLASGASTTAFFYLTATTATTTAQTHTVNLYTTRPDLSSGATCGDPFSLTVEETIKAVANKINTVVSGPTPPELGGIMTLTVTGDTGTIGSAGKFAFTPASFVDWAADKYQLVSAQAVLTGGNTGTYDNVLYLSGLGSSTTSYTITYKFVATGTTIAPTTVSPVSQISSGTQIKHNDTGSFGSLPPIPPTVNNITLSKQASPTVLATGGTATYTVTLSNLGTVDATLDEIVDLLPATPGIVNYIPGTAKFNGVSIPNPSILGQTLDFIGLFTVPRGGTSTLTYQATIPNIAGSYTNQVIGKIGSTQIDTTINTSDNTPATANVGVGSANLAVTKTNGVSTLVPGTTTSYTITVTNNGSATLNSLTLTDSVPADLLTPGFSPSSGSYNSNTGAWTGLTLGTGQSVILIVTGTVNPSATGTLVNTVTVSSALPDPDLTNNTASDTDTLTPEANLGITKTDGKTTISPGENIVYTLTITNSGPSSVSSVKVIDTVPSSILNPVFTPSVGSYDVATGTWSGFNLMNGQSIVLTMSGTINPSTTDAQVENTATIVLPNGVTDTDTTNNSSTDTTSISAIPVSSAPEILLVKRITAINGVEFTDIIDDTNSANDNAANWTLPLDPTSGISTFLRGKIQGGTVRPGDTVEYTIYFLSTGGRDATNVSICDLVPTNSSFVPTAFNNLSPLDGGLPGDSGIALSFGSTVPTSYLTNQVDLPDRGRFVLAGNTTPTSCVGANTDGAVVVDVAKNPAMLPKATGAGTPTNSYGFIRFHVRID